jgi:hypothetical protein
MSESMQLQKPSHLISLASSAVLVSVDINVWSATKQDRVISDEVTTAKKADKSAGRYVKNLLADHPKHKALINYRQTIYNWMKRRTYRWNQSQDLLPAIDMPRFMEEFRSHETEFNNLLSEFLASYEGIVSDMAFKQGDMFDRNDYPSLESISNKFGVNLFVSDVPMQDFRCQIAQDIADDLFKTYSKQSETIICDIMEQQVSRFKDVMESISHCCGYDESDKDGEVKQKKRKIYDSTIQKAKEMCESFKQFNLTNNTELEEARVRLEKTLRDVTAEDIRESDAIRVSVKEGVDDILSKFGSFKAVLDQ